MGKNCNIIITYYTENFTEQNEISKILGVEEINYFDNNSEIKSAGNRAWSPCDMQTHVICMKDWGTKECKDFIKKLRNQVNWQFLKTVQIYYLPATYDNHGKFKLVDLSKTKKTETIK